jgi:hypothetical protein
MAEHEESGSGERVREAVGNVLELLATLVRVAGGLIALILVAHVVLTVGNANPANGITRFIRTWADFFALGFRDLFTPEDAKLRVLVNYGLAAIFWLAATSLATRLLRRLA